MWIEAKIGERAHNHGRIEFTNVPVRDNENPRRQVQHLKVLSKSSQASPVDNNIVTLTDMHAANQHNRSVGNKLTRTDEHSYDLLGNTLRTFALGRTGEMGVCIPIGA